MIPTIRIPTVPIELPPGTVQIAGEVISTLPSRELEMLLRRLRDPDRCTEVLHEDDGHRVESHYTASGHEVWIIVRLEMSTALLVLPIEPQEEDI